MTDYRLKYKAPVIGSLRITALLYIAVSILILAAALEPSTARAAPAGPAQLSLNTEPCASWEDMAKRSDLIVLGKLKDQVKAYPTGRREGSYRIVHYVQKIAIAEAWKGGSEAAGSIPLLTSGIEPMPDAANSLNKRYTGPLEEGEYVFFLRRVDGNDYWTLTGLWQGLYPVYENKTIALAANGGFTALDGLTLEAFKKKVRDAASGH
jgi:hypothetical protein